MSKFLSLNKADLLKGFVVAFAMVLLSGIYSYLSATPPTFPTWEQLQTISLSGLGAGIAYLLKNLFTNSSGEILTKE